MTPIEIQRQAIGLLDNLAKEAISPRKRADLANAVRKQTDYIRVKQTDKDISTNLNHLYNHISNALQAFPNLKDKYPTALPLLSKIEALVKTGAGKSTPSNDKSGS